VKSEKGDNYLAWKIDEKNFPKKGSIEDQIRFLIGYGVLAPSTHNTQPWLFEITNDTLNLLPDPDRFLKTGDPDSWGMFISIGSFVENIVQAASVFGLSAVVKFRNDNGANIIFTKVGSISKNAAKVLSAIKDRHSNKFAYVQKKISDNDIQDLERLSELNTSLEIISDDVVIKKIINNHIDAAKSVAHDPKFALELSDWLRTNKTTAYDGMPGFVIGNSNAKSAVGKFLLKKKPQILQKLVVKDRQLLNSASAIVIFLAKGNEITKLDAHDAGRVIERFWLELTKKGLVGHPMFASIQSPKSRRRLALILGTKATPIFFMRIGYSKGVKLHTPRRIVTMPKSALSKLSDTLRSHPVAHKVEIGKYKINYITAGKGEPLLLIHGANIGWPQWHLNLDELAQKYKVYAIDLPGAGDSTKVNFRKTDFEKDYAEIVDKFVEKLGLKDLNVVGSSFGGWIAMRLAIMGRPYIKKLVVTNPIGFTRHMPAKFRPVSIWPLALFASKTALRPKRTNKNLEKFMRDVFYEKNRPLSNEFIDYFYELSKESHNVLFISRLAHMSGMRKELFLGKELSKIDVPTLVIWGKEDPLMPYKTVKDNFHFIKGVKVKVLENVGHMPPVENARAFNAETIKFLKGGEHDHS